MKTILRLTSKVLEFRETTETTKYILKYDFYFCHLFLELERGVYSSGKKKIVQSHKLKIF